MIKKKMFIHFLNTMYFYIHAVSDCVDNDIQLVNSEYSDKQL